MLLSERLDSRAVMSMVVHPARQSGNAADTVHMSLPYAVQSADGRRRLADLRRVPPGFTNEKSLHASP